MLHDCCQPLVETGLAKHGFPPCRGCGLSHTPQYAVGREVPSPHFQKTSPCKGEEPLHAGSPLWTPTPDRRLDTVPDAHRPIAHTSFANPDASERPQAAGQRL